MPRDTFVRAHEVGTRRRVEERPGKHDGDDVGAIWKKVMAASANVRAGASANAERVRLSWESPSELARRGAARAGERDRRR